MKTFTALMACVVILAIAPVFAFGQTGQSPSYRSAVTDTATATTAWDSVYTGGSHLKTVTFANNGTSGVLLCALENDTTAGHIIPVRAITGYGDVNGILTHARWVRTKISSGTLKRDVIISEPPTVK